MSVIPALASALLGDIKLTVPWDEIHAIPADVLTALQGGDTAPLRTHVASALDKAIDLSAIPIVGKMAEREQAALAQELVDGAADHVTAALTGAPMAHGTVSQLAGMIVDTPEQAAAVLAMGPIWKATHPALVAAARAIVAA